MPAASTTMPAGHFALARGRAYSLFGRLFQHGLTPEVSAPVQAIPELAAAVPGLNAAGGADFDSLAADHYALFGLNVFPYESIFLDVESNLGGPVAGEVMAFYQQAGFQVFQSGENPDHIRLELGLLAFLSSAEAEAWGDGLEAVALRLRELQRRFLDVHLLPWLPGLTQAIRQQGAAFYTALADLTLELAGEHRAGLAGGASAASPGFELPPAPDVLANEKTGLKEIASFLLSPAYSGMYLSREDISRLASRLGVPRGFGSREQMLTNLLRTAADYEGLPPLVEGLYSLAEDWTGFYKALSGDLRSLAPFAAPWLERLHGTRALLTTLSAQVK
jgi:TorA maturation chaperone TorD